MALLWEIPNDYPEALIGEYQEDISRDRFDFRKGDFVDMTDELIVFKFGCTLSELQDLGNLCNNSASPLVSPDVALIIKKHAKDDVQFFDAVVQAEDGKTNLYKLVNITKKINAIDKDNSELEYYTERETGKKFLIGAKNIKHLSNCIL